MSEVECRLEVDIDDSIPLGLRHTEHQAVFCDAGVVDQDVNSSELLYHFIYSLFYFFAIRSIGDEAQGFNIILFQLFESQGDIFLIYTGYSDIAAPATISRYISYLQDAFLISEAKRYDLKGKSFISGSSKYYFDDLGLRSVAAGFKGMDQESAHESLVA